MPCLVLARVINPDGTVIDVKPADVMVVGSSSSTTSDSRNVTWNYPRLDSGVVIEYIIQFKQRHSEAFDIGHAYLANDWDPMRNWSVEVRIPDSWAINEFHTPGLDYRTYDSSGTSVYQWSADSLALLVWEEDCPGTWDQGEWLRFAYRKTWREEADRYWKRVAVKFDTAGAVAELARSLTDGMKDKEDIIAALFRFVAKEIRYEAIEFGDGSIIPRPAPQVLENRFGDCKDKTTLLISMLKVHGIEAYPALISSYDTVNFVRDVPCRGFFNHMITYLPEGSRHYLDPTCSECGPYDLDIAYQGSPTLISGSELDQPLLMTPPPTPEDKQYHRRTRMVVQEDGMLNLEINFDQVGQTALNWKNYMSTADTSEVADMVKRYAGIGYWINTEFLGHELHENESESELRFGWTAHMEKDSLFIKPNTQVYVNLWFYSINDFLSIPDTTDRTLDVVVGQRFHLTDETTIVPGSEWELDNYRTSWTMDTTWFTASSRATEWDDSIRVAVEFDLKTPRIPLEELASFTRAVELVQNRVMNQRALFRRRPDAERIGLIEEALEKNPGDLSLIMSLPQLYLGDDAGGQSCRGAERRGKARSILSQAIDQGAVNESVIMYQASLLMADGMTLRADSLLKAYEAENQPSTILQALAANCAFTLADYENAESRYRGLLEQVPDDALRAQLVAILVREQKVDEARSQIDLLETLKADSAVFMGALLDYYLELDSLDQAAELIEVWPDTTKLVRASLKTSLHERTGKYEEAYEEFAALLAEDPENAGYLNNCAWFMALGDKNLTTALEMVDKSMELTGHCNGSFGNTRGLVLLKLGRVDEARSEFETGLEMQTAQSFTVNYYYLAKCALAEGKKDLAREFFVQACDANGDLMYTNAAREGLAELGGAGDGGAGNGDGKSR
jgi:tetratricopeptide (TPR) repeat protein